jgi:ribonuclease P protein subunit RPR2
MADKHKLKKEQLRKKAHEDILNLFILAKEIFHTSPWKANLYVHKARLLAMKHNLRFSREMKKQFCSHCYIYLIPGVNCRVRTREGKLIYYCLKCKKYMRMPLH